MKAYKDGSSLIFEKDGQTAIYDFANPPRHRMYKLTPNGNRRQVKSLNAFFTGIGISALSRSFEDKNYVKFLEKVSSRENRCWQIGTFLARLPRYAHYENYILLGLDFRNNISCKTSDYPKDILKLFKKNEWRFDSDT